MGILFIRLHRGLSRKIAQGGPLAPYLDGVRLTVATTTNSLLFAALVLHMCGAWLTR